MARLLNSGFCSPGRGERAAGAAGRPCQLPAPAEAAAAEAAAAGAEPSPRGRGAIAMHPTTPGLPGQPPRPSVYKESRVFYRKNGTALAGLCMHLLLLLHAACAGFG